MKCIITVMGAVNITDSFETFSKTDGLEVAVERHFV
jgi:hypothetical protein